LVCLVLRACLVWVWVWVLGRTRARMRACACAHVCDLLRVSERGGRRASVPPRRALAPAWSAPFLSRSSPEALGPRHNPEPRKPRPTLARGPRACGDAERRPGSGLCGSSGRAETGLGRGDGKLACQTLPALHGPMRRGPCFSGDCAAQSLARRTTPRRLTSPVPPTSESLAAFCRGRQLQGR